MGARVSFNIREFAAQLRDSLLQSSRPSRRWGEKADGDLCSESQPLLYAGHMESSWMLQNTSCVKLPLVSPKSLFPSPFSSKTQDPPIYGANYTVWQWVTYRLAPNCPADQGQATCAPVPVVTRAYRLCLPATPSPHRVQAPRTGRWPRETRSATCLCAPRRMTPRFNLLSVLFQHFPKLWNTDPATHQLDSIMT